nr:hypothetical protein [Escherichia coli O25b:H4-ST131]
MRKVYADFVFRQHNAGVSRRALAGQPNGIVDIIYQLTMISLTKRINSSVICA